MEKTRTPRLHFIPQFSLRFPYSVVPILSSDLSPAVPTSYPTKFPRIISNHLSPPFTFLTPFLPYTCLFCHGDSKGFDTLFTVAVRGIQPSAPLSITMAAGYHQIAPQVNWRPLTCIDTAPSALRKAWGWPNQCHCRSFHQQTSQNRSYA